MIELIRALHSERRNCLVLADAFDALGEACMQHNCYRVRIYRPISTRPLPIRITRCLQEVSHQTSVAIGKFMWNALDVRAYVQLSACGLNSLRNFIITWRTNGYDSALGCWRPRKSEAQWLSISVLLYKSVFVLQVVKTFNLQGCSLRLACSKILIASAACAPASDFPLLLFL